MEKLAAAMSDPAVVAGALAAIACLATVFTLTSPAMQGSKLESRLKAVANRREELRRGSLSKGKWQRVYNLASLMALNLGYHLILMAGSPNPSK